MQVEVRILEPLLKVPGIGSFGALAQFLYKLGGIVTMASTSEYHRKVLRLTTTQRVLYREGF